MNWKSLQKNTPRWFSDGKFGLFFHWGPYSVPACDNEWYSRNMYAVGLKQNRHHVETYGSLNKFGYKDFYPMLRGERFDAEQWAELVEASGAKYAGPVSEHADNFSMWDSQVNPVNCVRYGIGRDVTAECFSAFRNHGIRCIATFHHQWLWGWFMSTDAEADVYVPENERFYGPALPLETNRYMPYRLPDEAFNATWRDKILEVVEKYRPDALYFDSRANIIGESFRHEMLRRYYQQQPDGIITFKQNDFPTGVGVPDIERGQTAQIQPEPWQIDDRLEDNVTWCMVQSPKYRKANDVIQQLCDVVSKNGNLLLNVGPYADGSFHPDAVRELHAIGNWLKGNGEAIYGTVPWHTFGEGPTLTRDQQYDIAKVQQQIKTGTDAAMDQSRFTDQDYRFTARPGATYAIAMVCPADGLCHIHSFAKGQTAPVHAVTLLGDEPMPLEYEQTAEHLTVKLPEGFASQYPVTLKIQ